MFKTSWWTAVAAAVFVGVVLGMANLPTYRRLAQDGVRVDGVVTSTGCDTGRFTFTFDAESQTWAGRAGAWRVGVECATLIPGTRVPVYYRPDNPAEHAATRDPAALARQETMIVAAFTLVTLIGCAAIVWRERKRATPP